MTLPSCAARIPLIVFQSLKTRASLPCHPRHRLQRPHRVLRAGSTEGWYEIESCAHSDPRATIPYAELRCRHRSCRFALHERTLRLHMRLVLVGSGRLFAPIPVVVFLDSRRSCASGQLRRGTSIREMHGDKKQDMRDVRTLAMRLGLQQNRTSWNKVGGIVVLGARHAPFRLCGFDRSSDLRAKGGGGGMA